MQKRLIQVNVITYLALRAFAHTRACILTGTWTGPEKQAFEAGLEAYGKDWNEVAYRQYDHKNEEEVESIKVKLTPKMKQPAKPIKTKNRKCVKNTK